MSSYTKTIISRIFIDKAKYFIPALMWALVILLLSTGKNIPTPRLTNLLEPDKLAHAAAYFVLATLLSIGFGKGLRALQMRWVWVAALISSVYGIGMEIIQFTFFPNRYFEVYDIIANIIGALICVLVCKFLIK